MPKVTVTRQIPGDGIKILRDAGYEVAIGEQDSPMQRDKLLEFIKGSDAVMTQLQDKVDQEFIDAAGDNLKIVANYAVGFDNFDLSALSKKPIIATNTPNVLNEAVAEHTFALLLAIARRIVEADREARKQYLTFGPELFLGTELKDKTLGVMGLGRIGRRVAELAKAVGMNIIYYDIKPNPDIERDMGAEFKSTPEELLKEADAVSIHVPLLDSTFHLMNAERFKLMKKTAYFINTSRGQVVDEKALTDALKNNIIKGAAIDVCEHEPNLCPGLEKLDNLVVTPHIASATIESRSAMSVLAANNIVAVLSGKDAITPVSDHHNSNKSDQVNHEAKPFEFMSKMDVLYDVAVVGGGPAGTAAAVYAARKNLKTLLIADNIGGQSTVSSKIENWIGEPSIEGLELAKKFEDHLKRYSNLIEISSSEKVSNIQAVKCYSIHRICDFEIKTENEKIYHSKSIIIASGARRKKLNIPGEDKFEGKGVSYCATCDAPLFKNKRVAVIGGGNAGLEAVRDLVDYSSEIYLMHDESELRADAANISELKNYPNVKPTLLNVLPLEITGDNLVTGIKYKDMTTNEDIILDVDGIFIEIGSVPNSEFVKGLVNLDNKGQVLINFKHATTSHPGVFAAGDITDDPYKQNNIAAGDGVRAALAAYSYLQKREKVSPVDH